MTPETAGSLADGRSGRSVDRPGGERGAASGLRRFRNAAWVRLLSAVLGGLLLVLSAPMPVSAREALERSRLDRLRVHLSHVDDETFDAAVDRAIRAFRATGESALGAFLDALSAALPEAEARVTAETLPTGALLGALDASGPAVIMRRRGEAAVQTAPNGFHGAASSHGLDAVDIRPSGSAHADAPVRRRLTDIPRPLRPRGP